MAWVSSDLVVKVEMLDGLAAVLGAAEAIRAHAPLRAAGVGCTILSLSRCNVEEFEMPSWVQQFDLADCKIKRLMVGGGARTLCCRGGEVREVVLGGSELVSVDVSGCNMERLVITERSCLSSLVRLDVPDNCLSTYNIDPAKLPVLSTMNLSNNRIGRVDVRMPRLLNELDIGGNPSIGFVYPDCLFCVSRGVARDAYDFDRKSTMPVAGDAIRVLVGCTVEFLWEHGDVMEDLCALVEQAASDNDLGVTANKVVDVRGHFSRALQLWQQRKTQREQPQDRS
jgi:hypothetical protein